MPPAPRTASSSNMPPGSWKALASSKLSSLKDYVAQKDYRATYDALSSRLRGHNPDKQTWDQWAWQTLGKPYGLSGDSQRTSLGVEKVQLFPGWAVRRYVDPAKAGEEGAEFAMNVYVSGFASSVRPPEAATRSQKAFYRLAKGYAALPKLPVNTPSDHHPQEVDAMDLDLSMLPPRPTEVSDESELAALEAHLQQMSSTSSSRGSDADSDSGEDERPKVNESSSYHSSQGLRPELSTISAQASPISRLEDQVARRLHVNLDVRLQPFWSNAIPNRLVRLSLFCPRTGHAPSEAQESMEGQDTDRGPVDTQDVVTNFQGSFQTTFCVPWERLATYPPTLHIAFGDSDVEYPVVVQAEMWALPPSPSPSPSLSSSTGPVPYPLYQRSGASRSQPQLSPSSSLSFNQPECQSSSITNRVTVPLSGSHVPLRLISDIDDTIKHAGVLLGAKHVFQNVFVRHLDELVVHGMVDWYRMLWQKGVRFHYVSNSPFELLPVLNEFFRVSSLPQGSIKLKSYDARSLLPALFAPSAARKRQGVVEVLDVFLESRFILVGDSGEQDMELYAELARERPNQIVGVFIRDVTTGTGQRWYNTNTAQADDSGAVIGSFGVPFVDRDPEQLFMPTRDSLTDLSSSTTDTTVLNADHNPPLSMSSSSGVHSNTTHITSSPRIHGAPPPRKSSSSMTPEEKRVHELHARIERARGEIPKHIVFRVFQEPEECVEITAILHQYVVR